MKKALILLSAVLLAAAMAIPSLAEFPLEDFTIPDAGVHFAFNGDAKDEGGALTGELVGDPTFVEGRDGTANGAVYLDDNEQYILLGKNVDAESYTASFWAKVEDNTEHVFLCSSMLGSIRIIHDGGVVVGNTINGVVDNLSEYAAPRDEWVNLTFVYANETMDIYSNGELVGSLSGALPLPFTLLGNEASEQKGWQSFPFLTLDDAYFFGRAFSADEVMDLYNQTKDGAAYTASGAAAAPATGTGSAPSLLWDFNSDETISADMGANSNNAVSFWGEKDDAGNDYYVFVAGGGDPYVSVDLSAEDVSDVLWAKARVKNPGPAQAIELFGHTNGRGLTGSECTHINVAQDNEWHTYLVYIPDENIATVNAHKDPQYAITEPYWEGTVDWIRLDPLWQVAPDGSDSGGSMESGDEIYIDYIAFFPTKEAAEAFRADQDNYVDVAATPGYVDTTAPAEPTYTYPASGTEGNAITGTVIGNATGWGDNADAGAAAAFDGNPATFFDPLGVGDGFCGIDAGESYVLDKVVILSREGWNDRFPGAMIQGSNDGENWTTLWTSDTAGTNPDYYTVTEFENNTGYSQFRYYNETNHGDVAEVEFYGQPGKVEEAPAEEAPAEETPAEAPVDQTMDQKAESPNTFDFGILAAVASVISLGGFALTKKRH